MSTPITAPAEGFFAQLMPLLVDRTLMVIVSKADDQHLTLSVVPKRMKEGENTALATPLCCTGTPEELDRDLPTHLREFVAGHVTLSNNLAQIQRDREDAEKAAREELNKKRKAGGNGVVKDKPPEGKLPEEKKVPSEPQTSMMSLFDQPTEVEARPRAVPSVTATDDNGGATTSPSGSNNNDNNNNTVGCQNS
jgi:PRTRC genetic system protein E